MTTLLSTIGRSLLISCMIPAIVLVTVTMVIYVPLLPTDLLTRLNVIEPPPPQISPIPTPQTAHTPPTQTSAIPTPLVQVSPIAIPIEPVPATERQVDFGSVLSVILVFSFLLAYFLMIMNWAIVRLYEGYYVPSQIRDFFIQKQVQKKTALAECVADQRRNLPAPSLYPDLYKRQWRLYVEKQDQLISQFPEIAGDMLPFRLGNIYRAFEDYSFSRYNMLEFGEIGA